MLSTRENARTRPSFAVDIRVHCVPLHNHCISLHAQASFLASSSSAETVLRLLVFHRTNHQTRTHTREPSVARRRFPGRRRGHSLVRPCFLLLRLKPRLRRTRLAGPSRTLKVSERPHGGTMPEKQTEVNELGTSRACLRATLYLSTRWAVQKSRRCLDGTL